MKLLEVFHISFLWYQALFLTGQVLFKFRGWLLEQNVNRIATRNERNCPE